MIKTNNLAIVLLATLQEYKAGLVTKCLDEYLNKSVSCKYTFDFFIFFNRPEINNYSDLEDYKLHSNINNLFIINYNYSDAEDLYVRTPQEMRRNPSSKQHALGGSGGANLLFYDSMLHCFNLEYDNFMMIECDSRPIVNNWFDRLNNGITNKDFLIMGSRYKGYQTLPSYESWTGHLNGIAVYKNVEHTRHFLLKSRELIKYSVSHNINKFISFDVANWNYSQTLEWKNYLTKHNIYYQALVESELISNYSLYVDSKFSKEDILSRNPQTIILHQKWN